MLRFIAKACGWPRPLAGGVNRSSGSGDYGKSHQPWRDFQNSRETASIE